MIKETIEAKDGYRLSASCFRPEGPARGAVLIVPAMGVPKSFYAALGAWLADKGFLAMCFDFRGIGDSRSGHIRQVSGDLITWANDTGIVLKKLVDESSNLPVTLIGHSLGGQIPPLIPGHDHLRKVLTIATGSGYWLENSWSLRWKVGLLWFIMVPLLVPLCGYFPGKRLKMVGDLPGGVMSQWRRWCLNPEYCVGAEGETVRKKFADFSAPVVSISFTDDEMMSARNTESLHSFYCSAEREMIRVAPADFGLRRIGHFGFFRKSMRELLWEKLLLPKLAICDQPVAL